MEFKIEKSDDVVIVGLMIEALDAGNAKEFKSDISPLLIENKKVLFDMSKVKFVDSSGCGTLLSCLRRLNSEEGDLKLMGVQKAVQTLFELVRMHRIIEIFDNREEALDSFTE
ncbi:MAG: STAS domain-containing protein [Deltaproteobacteria bacterium]|nr:STAS domain-containing protein [Deltaproteobacteria bacterium]